MDAGIPRTVTVTEQSDTGLREAFGVGATVTVPESDVTTEHTARVRVALEDETARSHRLTYTRERCDLNLLTGRYEDRAAGELVLVSTEQAWEKIAADCWVPDGRNLDCGIPAVDHEVTVDPGDPVRWTFRLWASPKGYANGVCMPPGRCRFERTFRAGQTTGTLSFGLSIDRE